MTISFPSTQNIAQLRARLLDWFALNQRDLPWRRTSDPYAIWVSEIMLQQTRVAAVMDRYLQFMEHFPDVQALARAEESEVLALWSGLGYYRRARMLHQAARVVVSSMDGKMPTSCRELRLLPGVGAYTGAAIASIAHGELAAVVDGNVERVVCRLRGWEADKSSALRRRVETAAGALLDPAYPGNFNQAMMELGAMVCLPRSPLCEQCPLLADCSTRGEHKTQPRAPMVRKDVAYALVLRQAPKQKSEREVLLEQRAATETVMPGLWQLPQLRRPAVPKAKLLLTVSHAIMQVNYNVMIRESEVRELADLAVENGERRWFLLAEAEAIALTGLARKVLHRVGLLAGRRSVRR